MTDKPVPKDRPWVIYTLHDPRIPKSIRYVGVTHDRPQSRLSRHLSSAKKMRFHSERWVNSLLVTELRPVMIVIDSGVGPSWEEREVFWIAWHKEQGHKLTNHALGGRGPVGCIRTPETRAKLAVANLGKKQSPELIAKRIAPLVGGKHSPESRARMSAGSKGRKVSPEGLASIQAAREADPTRRDRVSASNKKTWAKRKAAGLVSSKGRTRPTPKTEKRLSEATKAKMSGSRTGKVQTPETKALRREIMLRIWAERPLLKQASL